MDKLRSTITANRPKLSESSVKTYSSILSNLFKKIKKDDSLENAFDFFCKNVKEVLGFLKDTPSSKRKTILASLVVLVEKHEKAADQYRKQMLDDKKAYDDEEKDQKMSDSQRENWVSQEELKKLYDQLDKENRPLLTREKLSGTDFQKLQNWVILSLYYLQPPRRLKDYTEMKLRNFDEEKDNFIKGNNLVFNQYKTAKAHGKEVIPMSQKLKFILVKWRALNTHDYLLVSVNGKKLTSTQLQQRLNQILGKKASVNILRHSFLSEKYKDLPAVRELEERAEAMGHTVEQALLYIKKDAPVAQAEESKEESPKKKPPRKRLQKSGSRVRRTQPVDE
jgi:integrase